MVAESLVTDFSFVEISAVNMEKLYHHLENMGFRMIGYDPHGKTHFYGQGEAILVVREDPLSFAHQYAKHHDCFAISGLGFKVRDSHDALAKALAKGAIQVYTTSIPAVYGLGGTLIYFVDNEKEKELYKELFPLTGEPAPKQFIKKIDHVTGHVPQGQLDRWIDFYVQVLGLHLMDDYEIDVGHTRYRFSSLISSNGQVRLPINEALDDQSTVAEFLKTHKGSGMQHIAFQVQDIFATVSTLKKKGVDFLKTPDDYYNNLKKQGNPGDISILQEFQILADYQKEDDQRQELLQIFTHMALHPLFFEFIERHHHEGFGQGNAYGLSQALEMDQHQRGVL